MKRKICVITGSRAEYGLMECLMRKIKASDAFTLQILATGSHFIKELGNTYQEIENDGFQIDSKLEILQDSKDDSALSIANAMSLCLKGVAATLSELKADLIVVLGDRYEILAAVQAAMLCRIPVAHIAGGDVGNGTYDNIIRHCITKLSALHFVTHEAAARRVIQMGEDKARVFNVGSPGVDNIKSLPLMSREELEKSLEIRLKKDIYLVTYHPLTMGGDGIQELNSFLEVLEELSQNENTSIIFTKANADEGGKLVNKMLESFVAKHSHNCHLFDSLGRRRYLSMVKVAKLVLGNSSSGVYEAPYLETPTVDIGLRQLDRVGASSVFRAEGSKESIENAVKTALQYKFGEPENVYGDGEASQKILSILESIPDFSIMTNKKFHDLNF